MAGPLAPISPVSRSRALRRRLQLWLGRREPEATPPPEPEADREPPPPPKAHTPEAGVAAQLLGEQERRGLRAGMDVRGKARATYLSTEYAGPRDRRPAKGRITKTEV